MRSLLICDLDGTLIDSFAGIAEAVRFACESVGVGLPVPITRSLMGPPLDDLLRSIAGPVEPEVFARLREAFIEDYDRRACRLAVPFAGVSEMLKTVRSRGHALALATNKRLVPTKAILETLGWSSVFAKVETVDSRPGARRRKDQMLEAILQEWPGRAAVLYLGDTADDTRAAAAAKIPCILATWGQTGKVEGTATMAATPQDVTAYLEAASAHSHLAS